MDVTDETGEKEDVRKVWNETNEEVMKRERNGWDRLGLGRNEMRLTRKEWKERGMDETN